jgi:hypothetical protein
MTLLESTTSEVLIRVSTVKIPTYEVTVRGFLSAPVILKMI